MNIFYIIFNDVIDFIRRIPKLFVIMAISLLVSAFGVLFMLNLNDQLRLHKLQSDLSTRTYTIQFQQENDNDVVYQVVSEIITDQDLPGIDILEYQTISGYYVVIGYYRSAEFFDWRIRPFLGESFTIDELNSAADVVMISDSVMDIFPDLPTPPVGASIQEFDTEFRITGVFGFRNQPHLYLPYKTFEKNRFIPQFVEIVFNQGLSDEQLLAFTQVLATLPNEATLKLPEPLNRALQNEYYLNTAIIVLVLILAIFNILSIFSYWIRFNRMQYMIYRICGAQSVTIAVLVVVEILVISTLMFGLAMFLYRYLTPLMLQNLLDYANNWSFYIHTFLVFQGCILLAVSKTALQIMTTTSLATQLRMEV